MPIFLLFEHNKHTKPILSFSSSGQNYKTHPPVFDGKMSTKNLIQHQHRTVKNRITQPVLILKISEISRMPEPRTNILETNFLFLLSAPRYKYSS